MNAIQLTCDYLVVGAGAAAIAFIDTLLTRHPSTSIKIVLVDKNPIPGGHWVNAYGYVRLHQPSIVYGVASRQL
jgi:cation diffusion facilitator CzcD-associated flavoprotein CzcO